MFYFLKLILKIKATSLIQNPHHYHTVSETNRLFHITIIRFWKKKEKEHQELCCVEEGTANRNTLNLRNPRRHCCLLPRTLSNSLSLILCLRHPWNRRLYEIAFAAFSSTSSSFPVRCRDVIYCIWVEFVGQLYIATEIVCVLVEAVIWVCRGFCCVWIRVMLTVIWVCRGFCCVGVRVMLRLWYVIV